MMNQSRPASPAAPVDYSRPDLSRDARAASINGLLGHILLQNDMMREFNPVQIQNGEWFRHLQLIQQRGRLFGNPDLMPPYVPASLANFILPQPPPPVTSVSPTEPDTTSRKRTADTFLSDCASDRSSDGLSPNASKRMKTEDGSAAEMPLTPPNDEKVPTSVSSSAPIPTSRGPSPVVSSPPLRISSPTISVASNPSPPLPPVRPDQANPEPPLMTLARKAAAVRDGQAAFGHPNPLALNPGMASAAGPVPQVDTTAFFHHAIQAESNQNYENFRVGLLSQMEGSKPRNRRNSMPEAKVETQAIRDGKDAAYFERRRKNNEAAKRSRDARRAKEMETSIRCKYLEMENDGLRQKLAVQEQQLMELKKQFLTNN